MGALLAYPEESSLCVRCGDSELRHSFWGMISFPIHVLDRREDSNKLPEGPFWTFYPILSALAGLLSGGSFVSLETPR